MIGLGPKGALRASRTATAVRQPSRNAGTVASLALAGLWVLYSITPPAPAGISIDPSWRIALTMAARDHLQFGRDIAFTYGPLGYVLAGVADPGLAASSAAIAVFTALIAAAGVWTAAHGRAGPLPRLALIAVMLLVSSLLGFDYVLFAGIVALLSRFARFPGSAIATGAAVGLIGLFGTLSKFTLGLDVFAAAGAVWLVDFIRGPLRRRRATALALGTAVAIAAIGLAATFRFVPSAAAEYVRTAAQIGAGYSDAMMVSGDNREVVLAAAIAALILAVGVMAWRERKPTIAPLAAIVLFLAWKHGFVRQDAHVIYYFGAAAALAAVIGLTVRRPRAMALGLVATVASAAGFLFIDAREFGARPFFSPSRLLGERALSRGARSRRSAGSPRKRPRSSPRTGCRPTSSHASATSRSTYSRPKPPSSKRTVCGGLRSRYSSSTPRIRRNSTI